MDNVSGFGMKIFGSRVWHLKILHLVDWRDNPVAHTLLLQPAKKTGTVFFFRNIEWPRSIMQGTQPHDKITSFKIFEKEMWVLGESFSSIAVP